MPSYVELKAQEREIVSKINAQANTLDSNKSYITSLRTTLDNLESEKNSKISLERRKAEQVALSEATSKYYDMINTLNTSKEKVLAVRDSKLESIVYEDYKSRYTDNKSIDSYLNKCFEIRGMIEEKQGLRLSKSVSLVIPSDSVPLNSLKDIENEFNNVDKMLHYVSKDPNIFEKIVESVFSYDFSKISGEGVYISVIVLLVISVAIYFASPLLVLAISFLFFYNIYRSYMFYECYTIINSLEPNIDSLKKSIEDGIITQMAKDKDFINSQYALKLNEFNDRIDLVRDKIEQVISITTSDFSFNVEPIETSFKMKKSDIDSLIASYNQKAHSIESSLAKLKEDLQKVKESLNEYGINARTMHYPPDKSMISKQYEMIESILVDVVDNQPIYHKIPNKPTLYIYEDRSIMLQFLKLIISSIYLKVKCSSFDITILDTVSASKDLSFFGFKEENNSNFTKLIDFKDFQEYVTSLSPEMSKRINLMGQKNIKQFNEPLIEDKSSPMVYKIIIDLASKIGSYSETNKQVIRNGSTFGIMNFLFIEQSELYSSSSNKDVIETLFEEFYFISSKTGAISKKSKNLVLKPFES